MIALKRRTIGSAICIALCGCSGGDIPPHGWDTKFPGVYVGNQSGFKEVVQFNRDNTFTHAVYHGTNQLHSGTGMWRFDSALKRIKLSEFFEFYDPMNNSFSTTPNVFYSYEFFPVSNAGRFDKISADVDRRYCLTRTMDGVGNPQVP